jgi:hypothetical protein
LFTDLVYNMRRRSTRVHTHNFGTKTGQQIDEKIGVRSAAINDPFDRSAVGR